MQVVRPFVDNVLQACQLREACSFRLPLAASGVFAVDTGGHAANPGGHAANPGGHAANPGDHAANAGVNNTVNNRNASSGGTRLSLPLVSLALGESTVDLPSVKPPRD